MDVIARGDVGRCVANDLRILPDLRSSGHGNRRDFVAFRNKTGGSHAINFRARLERLQNSDDSVVRIKPNKFWSLGHEHGINL